MCPNDFGRAAYFAGFFRESDLSPRRLETYGRADAATTERRRGALASGVTLSFDTGVVVSAAWDASLLGSADGSAVEVRVVGHRSGGSPTKRRTVEVGAVEWNRTPAIMIPR